MKTEIRTDLLRKLADHLLNGKLGHQVFDFSTYNQNYDCTNKCGTNGCAIGECPIVFPDDWIFNAYYEPQLKNIDAQSFVVEKQSGQEFFKISEEQYEHLFLPDYQKTEWGIKYLHTHSTKEDVANNIIKFCELAEAGKL